MTDFCMYYFYCMFSYQIPVSCFLSSPISINGWVLIYELSGSGFESRCSHLNQSVKLGVKLVVCNLKNDQISQIKIYIHTHTEKQSRCYIKKLHRDTTLKYINTPQPIIIVSALRITGHHLFISDPENFVSDYVDEIEYKYDELSDFEKRIRKFEQDLKIPKEESKDSFYHAILYGTYISSKKIFRPVLRCPSTASNLWGEWLRMN